MVVSDARTLLSEAEAARKAAAPQSPPPGSQGPPGAAAPGATPARDTTGGGEDMDLSATQEANELPSPEQIEHLISQLGPSPREALLRRLRQPGVADLPAGGESARGRETQREGSRSPRRQAQA